MLRNINMLFLGATVLILLDISYLSRLCASAAHADLNSASTIVLYSCCATLLRCFMPVRLTAGRNSR